MVVDLSAQLDQQLNEKHKIEAMVRELLDARQGRSSERLSKDQLALFEALWQAHQTEQEQDHSEQPGDDEPPAAGGSGGGNGTPRSSPRKRGGRGPLPAHLERKRVEYDLAEADKHCSHCDEDLRPIGEDTSEHYEYVPASVTVTVSVCKKYACSCTVRTASKPPLPIEKSTAGASVLAQVVTAKFADHLPLHRQQKMWARFGVELSRKTMGGWLGQLGEFLEPLYQAGKKILFESTFIGTDDTPVKVLDQKLDFARTGRIWPYVGDGEHPVVLFDYTPTRQRAGPEKFLAGYEGILQADALNVYDAFFKPGRGLTEGGCWMHGRRYFIEALESDQARMGPALALIAKLYRVEDLAAAMTAEERLALRQRYSVPVLNKLRRYLLQLQPQVLPKSPAGAAVRYVLNHWEALILFASDGKLPIDNGAVERANRSFAVGRNNWTFFGSDQGGRTAAVLASFVASCQRVRVNPFNWFCDVLTRMAGGHPVNRLAELLPHNWKAAGAHA